MFAPLPVETMGGWLESAANHIKRLGQALARATGQVDSESVSHLFQHLSVLLMKGNMSLLLARVPGALDPQIDGRV